MTKCRSLEHPKDPNLKTEVQMKILAKSVVVICSLLFSSCANFTHYNNSEKIKNEEAVFVDAKQRVIYDVSVPKLDEKSNTVIATFNGYCAEPSPDAMSALAASLGVDLTVADEGKLGLTNTLAEGVSNIGVRTGAIQALRDFMYRNCEAYAIGGITSYGLETLQRRFQSTMVAILAIEQLTGAVQSPPVTIQAETEIGSPEAILELTQKSELAKSQLDDAVSAEEKSKEKLTSASEEVKKSQEAIDTHNKEIAAIKEKPEGEQTTAEKEKLANNDETLKGLNKTLEEAKVAETKAKEEHESASETAKKRKAAYDAIESSRVAATVGGGTAKMTASYAQSIAPKPMTPEVAEKLASSVTDIVKATTGELSYWNEVCTTVFGQNINETPNKGSVLSVCTKLLITANDEDLRKKYINSQISFDYEPPSENERLKLFQELLSGMKFKDSSGKDIKIDGAWGNQMKDVTPTFLSTCSAQLGSRANTEASLNNIENLIKAARIADTKGCKAS